MSKITLTTAVQITEWDLAGLELRPDRTSDPSGSNAQVVFILENNVGDNWRYAVRGSEANTLLQTINTTDFSSPNPTFYQRALQYLINNNVLDGTVE